MKHNFFNLVNKKSEIVIVYLNDYVKVFNLPIN